MVEINNIRFLLFVSLMTFPVHGLDVILSNVYVDFKQKYEINIKINTTNGEKIYDGTLNKFTYHAQPDTSKVIVHISSKSRFVEIMRHAVRETRMQIARELFQWHYELVFLGIENFDDDEYDLISEFLIKKIRRNRYQASFTIETIGVNRFDHLYQYQEWCFAIYEENAQICGGNLLPLLRSIQYGALPPIGRNDKKIKLHEFLPVLGEVTWSVDVEDGIYVPNVNVSHPKYNFRKKHPNKKIHLVILSGSEYSTATNIGRRSSQMTEISGILRNMLWNNEVMTLLGAFNFDWTEVDIVLQILLQHSDGWLNLDQSVFTCGFGIFNTEFSYVYKDNQRFLLQYSNPSVSQTMKILIGKEVKRRSINVYYCDIEWDIARIPIYLCNGQYFPGESINNLSFPRPNQKMAAIVCDSTEIHDQADFVMMCQYVTKLKESGIYVVIIEAINFGLNDMHIIAEWMDWLRGDIDPEQISILGAGIFDTIFQSKLATYNTFLYKKNELQTIQNVCVKSANEKWVFAAKFDNLTEVRTYPINTVNGFYEPDLISDKNMFDSGHRKQLFFIITSAAVFLQLSTVINMDMVTLKLRNKIENHYPSSNWSVYLVGLDNFGERDSHLFGEVVGAHTYDERPLTQFARTFSHGVAQVVYHFRDTPFTIEDSVQKQTLITSFIGYACGLSWGSRCDQY